MAYTIVGRYMNGVKVIGYCLVDEYGKEYRVDRDKVESLALSGQILNCSGQRYKGKIILKGRDKPLTELKTVNIKDRIRFGNKFKIEKRVIQDRRVLGYSLRGYNGEERIVSKVEIIDMISQGMILNARIQRNGDKVVIRGVGDNLAALPSIKKI